MRIHSIHIGVRRQGETHLAVRIAEKFLTNSRRYDVRAKLDISETTPKFGSGIFSKFCPLSITERGGERAGIQFRIYTLRTETVEIRYG